jgi:hypothetical protein
MSKRGRKLMSIRTGIAVAAGLIAVALASNAGAEMFAPTTAAKPKKVTITGCAKSVPPFCIMIGDKSGNYSVTAAVPPVPTDKRVKVQGTAVGPGPCGLVLENVKWVATKGKC